MKKMKSIIQATIALISAAVLGSCNKAFDVERVGAVTPEQQWGSPEFIEFYINNFYNVLPAWNRNENYSEEAGTTTLPSALKGTAQTQDGYPDRSWDYSSVRGLNTFFANIENSKAILSDDQYKVLKGQAYFFRAYVYYKMVKVLGGVPIITDVQDPTSDPKLLMVARNTSLECFDFIEKQLDSAAMLLPSTWDANNTGRITKGAALAVKGEMLLLKASPLFCKTKNPTYWTNAYNALTAAKNELDANGYGLYSESSLKATENWWYKKSDAAKEMVLYLRYNFPNKTNGFQAAQRPLTVSSGAAGGAQPTWELVKSFPMKNGKSITDPTSGYNEKQYWKDRDPRFYTTVVYNGAQYDFAGVPNRIQWVFNGIAGDDGYKTFNYTGFYARKEIDTTLSSTLWNNQAFDWPIIRYAEVLLNLAEAANETGHSADAKTLMISVRQRAHINAGAGDYGLAANVGSDYQATLNAIMLERQVEFTLEGKRFWDLRRRRMFGVLNNYGTMHAWGPYLNKQAAKTYGIDTTGSNSEIAQRLSNVVLNPGSIDVNKFLQDITNYSHDPIDISSTNQINMKDYYYFGPLDPAWILQDPNLKQNIGWDNGDFDPTIQ
ncbi:RagB/SusD family nutrient uptake outer membrane protein [Danxiaibacter flavus]|uniref:RagB/SusD family nutrient uptake outer membrane protein n=1 Tax=Danxiaibacter flavus TaxID=3049108 RepID=A0ABV3ZLD0_9BACT|nr:RagB/SusD family nutrient uptake outer membrane protein [Chitinophagaceae bacterium DXS]